jgi:DNA-directed RNA polymerase specialized sigma subunit
VKKKLDEIIDKQPQIEKYSIEQIMEQELATLEERLTVTADGELMLEDELDSADYQYLKQTPECIIIDQSIEQKVLELLDKPQKKELADNEQKAFWRLYRVLPTQSKAVVELYVFGGLTRAEVADIMHIAEYQVDAVLNNFTQNLRKLPK